MTWILIGTVVGLAAFLAAVRAGRARPLAAGYGVVAGAAAVGAAALVHSNRVEGMGGLVPAVGAGLLLWYVVFPGVLGIGYLEWRGRQRRQGRDARPGVAASGPSVPLSRRPSRDPDPDLPAADISEVLGGARGIGMRIGTILVLAGWGHIILGLTGLLPLLLISPVGWVIGGQWERSTRNSPHRVAHALLPWILSVPSLFSLVEVALQLAG